MLPVQSGRRRRRAARRRPAPPPPTCPLDANRARALRPAAHTTCDERCATGATAAPMGPSCASATHPASRRPDSHSATPAGIDSRSPASEGAPAGPALPWPASGPRPRATGGEAMPEQYAATDKRTGLQVTVTGDFPPDPDDRVRIARTSTLFTRLMATILDMDSQTERREGFRAVETQLEVAEALLRRGPRGGAAADSLHPRGDGHDRGAPRRDRGRAAPPPRGVSAASSCRPRPSPTRPP